MAVSANDVAIDEFDLPRARFYDLLATLLAHAPSAEILSELAAMEADESAFGRAIAGLRDAAAGSSAAAIEREYFQLFTGIGRGELLPYASYYQTGFLNERPLARVREDMRQLGIERAQATSDPEDHIAILFDVMAGLAAGRFEAEPGAQAAFFARNLLPWAERFFVDLEKAESARFYRAVGGIGRLFVEVETEAFAMDA